jgi:hypothetical protein
MSSTVCRSRAKFQRFAHCTLVPATANYVEVTTTTMLQVGSNTITAPGGLAFAINPPGTLLLTASLGGTTGWTTSAVFDVVLMSEPNWQTFKAGGILGVTTVLQSGVSSVAMMSIPVQQQSPPGKYYVVLDNGFGFGTMPPFGSSLTVIWGFLFTPTGGGGATTPTTTIVTTAPATTTTTIVNTPPATTTTTTTTTTIVTTAPPTPVAPTTAKGPTPGVPRCPAQLGGTPQGTNCNIIRNVETCTYYCNNRMCTVSLPNGSQTDTLMCDGTTGAGTQPPSTTRAPTPAATSLTTNVPFTPPPTTPQRTTDQFITPAPTPMQPTPSYTTPPTIGIPTDPPPTPIGGVFTFAPVIAHHLRTIFNGVNFSLQHTHAHRRRPDRQLL